MMTAQRHELPPLYEEALARRNLQRFPSDRVEERLSLIPPVNESMTVFVGQEEIRERLYDAAAIDDLYWDLVKEERAKRRRR